MALFAGWTMYFLCWRAFRHDTGAQLTRIDKQWYIGRDGKADAEADIESGKLRMYGSDCGDVEDSFVTSSYRKILKEEYGVEWISLFGGDVVPDRYVLPYINSYCVVVTEYLKGRYGADIMNRIHSEAKASGSMNRKVFEEQNRARSPEHNAGATSVSISTSPAGVILER